MNSPGAPSRLPIGSVLSIIQSAGSASVAAHALPRANLTIGQVFHSELHRYHTSGFQAKGTVTVRTVSGSHGSSFNCCVVPYRTSERRCAVTPTSAI